MFDIIRKEIQWGGRKLVLETGRIARQADGAVLVSYGDTVVLCTVVGLSVEDLSEAGGPFLGVNDCSFHQPVHPGQPLLAARSDSSSRNCARVGCPQLRLRETRMTCQVSPFMGSATAPARQPFV